MQNMRRAESLGRRPFDTESPANEKNIEIIFSDGVSVVCGTEQTRYLIHVTIEQGGKLPPKGFPNPEITEPNEERTCKVERTIG